MYQTTFPSIDEDRNNPKQSCSTHLSDQYTDINKMHHLIDKTNPAQNMVILSINIRSLNNYHNLAKLEALISTMK